MNIDQFRKKFADESACRHFFEAVLWPSGRYCPHCFCSKSYALSGKSTRAGLYECAQCKRQFTVTTVNGATFEATMIGEPDDLYLIASDAGYGFVVKLMDLYTKNRNGKSVLTLPAGSKPIAPIPIHTYETDRVVAISNEGRMLHFPLTDLPKLSRGKGNKIISIPTARVKTHDEFLLVLTIFPAGGHIIVHAGKRYIILKSANLDPFAGKRGHRGKKLPRGFQKVDRVEVVSPKQMQLM